MEGKTAGYSETIQKIAEVSTVSTIDTIAVLEGLVKVVPQNIADGKIVRLGDFGNFSLSVSGEGADKETEVTVANIKSNHNVFII